MSNGSPEEFTPEEQAILNAIPREDDEQTDGQAPQGGEASSAHASEPGANGAPAQTSQADPASTTTDPAKPSGDVRAALRAARRGEARALERARQLETELNELRQKVPSTPDPNDLTDEEIAEAERDIPLLAKTARFVKAQRSQQAAATTPQASNEFVPPSLPAEVQEVVDGNEHLLAWQYDPDQTRFDLAKSVDAMLQRHPAWASKTLEQRFAEVVRRVNHELPPTASRASQALANAKTVEPETLTHMGGGGGKAPEAPHAQRFQKMSDDEIFGELARLG